MGNWPRDGKRISKPDFYDLQPGVEVVMNHMIGKAVIASEPYRKNGEVDGAQQQFDAVRITFESGPWEGRTFEVYRQLINRAK